MFKTYDMVTKEDIQKILGEYIPHFHPFGESCKLSVCPQAAATERIAVLLEQAISFDKITLTDNLETPFSALEDMEDQLSDAKSALEDAKTELEKL